MFQSKLWANQSISFKTPKEVGVWFRWVGLLFCVGWLALLWRGWLKLFNTAPIGGGSLASVDRVALLCRLVCPFVLVGVLSCGRVWLELLKTTPKGVGALFQLYGLPFYFHWVAR